MSMPPIIMTIAGSDSCAGAGIQADIKTISALNAYATCVITAVTAQNTQRVSGIHSVPTDFIKLQFDTINSDFRVNAIKTGMLQNADVIVSVAKNIETSGIPYLVVDPVIVATSGGKLVLENTIDALKTTLFPIATVITPNLIEAESILNRKIDTIDEMKRAARDLLDFGMQSVLIKGGHLTVNNEHITDVFASKQNNKTQQFTKKKIFTNNTHGTGCTLSAAIATFIAFESQNIDNSNYIINAISNAENYIQQAIIAGSQLSLTKNNGPLWHFVN